MSVQVKKWYYIVICSVVDKYLAPHLNRWFRTMFMYSNHDVGLHIAFLIAEKIRQKIWSLSSPQFVKRPLEFVRGLVTVYRNVPQPRGGRGRNSHRNHLADSHGYNDENSSNEVRKEQIWRRSRGSTGGVWNWDWCNINSWDTSLCFLAHGDHREHRQPNQVSPGSHTYFTNKHLINKVDILILILTIVSENT